MTIPDRVRVLICGSGSAGNVLAGMLGARPDVVSTVFTRNSTTVDRWLNAMASGELMVLGGRGDHARVLARANPHAVTDDPSVAADCDIAILAVPAFLHEGYLAVLAPHLPEGCLVVGLPGQPGFEFAVRHAAGGAGRQWPLVNFDSLPWVCRLVELGRGVWVSATKQQLVGAAEGDLAQSRVSDPVGTLQSLLGTPPTLRVRGHVLGITLRSPNASNHPPMMYRRWRDWDGTPVREAPLFYEGIDAPGAELLEHISQEVVGTAAAIVAQRPGIDLSAVVPQFQWELEYYGDAISDPSCLLTALRTNSGYAGITHPVRPRADGSMVPDFSHRYLSEDVPYGLVVMRGIAEVIGLPTPHMDAVISWSQERLGKCYLEGGCLSGSDVGETRCPQRYGMTTLDDMLDDQAPVRRRQPA